MRTKRRSNEQLKKTSRTREKVFEFMRTRFHGREYWTIDGPMDTEVDEIMCFAIFDTDGESMGVVIVQTWLDGGWHVYVPPQIQGTDDEADLAIRTVARRPISKVDDAETSSYVVNGPVKLTARGRKLLEAYAGLNPAQLSKIVDVT